MTNEQAEKKAQEEYGDEATLGFQSGGSIAYFERYFIGFPYNGIKPGWFSGSQLFGNGMTWEDAFLDAQKRRRLWAERNYEQDVKGMLFFNEEATWSPGTDVEEGKLVGY